MKHILHFLFLTMIVCSWRCSGGDEDVPTPAPKPETTKIEITTSAPVMEQKGGTATISFTTNAAWTANVGTSTTWLKVSPTSGPAGTHTLTVTTTENATYDERNAAITFVCGDKKQIVTITQKQKDALIVTSNKVEIGAEGGDIAIELKANVKFEYEIEEVAQSWITSNGSRALTTSSLNFKVAENENTFKREGKIIVRSDELSETVTIYQEGSKPTIVLTQDEYTVSSEGETIKVELKSNVDYEIQLSNAGWIKESSSRAMSAATHYFEIASNEEYDSRSAEILFVNKENGLSEKVIVNQMQKDVIIVTKNEFTVVAAGGELNLEVNTNVDFKVEISVDWIKQNNTESRGLETKSLNFDIIENPEDGMREGFITISSENIEQSIKVIQQGQYVFSVRQKEYIIDNIGETIEIIIDTEEEYTVETEKVGWLSEIYKNNSDDMHVRYFAIAANEEYAPRSTKIVFKDKRGYSETVNIHQKQTNVIMITRNEYVVDTKGGNLDIGVTANVDFNVKTTVDWIILKNKSRGLRDDVINFTIKENTTDKYREGIIMFSYHDLLQMVIVKQDSGGNTESGLDDFQHGGSM